jgi:hypothetical protein
MIRFYGLVRRLFELSDTPAKRAGCVGQLAGAEDDQDNHQDQEQMHRLEKPLEHGILQS